MKIKNAKHLNLFVALATGFIFLNSSCSKVEDLYNQPEGQGVELIPNGNISSAFNWATTKSINLQIAVNDQFDGKYFYKLEIFDREPHAKGANILAAGVAKKGHDLVTSASVPTGLQYIYIQQTSPTGVVSYSMVEVKGGTVSNTAGGIKTASINTKGINLLASTSPLNTPIIPEAPTQPTVPSTAYSVSGNVNVSQSIVNSNKNIVIEEGATFTGEIPLDAGIKGITVYVKGTWNRGTNNVTIGAENSIIVLGTGSIVAKDLSMPSTLPTFINFGSAKFNQFSVNNTGNIANYNVLNVTTSLNIPSHGTFVNTGTFTATSLSINSNGTFKNAGSTTLTGTMDIPDNALVLNTGTATFNKVTGNSSTGTLTNNGIMTIEELNFTNAVFNVNCHTFVQTVTEFNGAKVNISSGAKLDIHTIQKSGGTIYSLAENGILNVQNQATFTTYSNTITGKANSLARFQKIVLQGHQSVLYKGSVVIATNNHPENKPNNVFYVADNTASIADYNNTSVIIASTSCNDGGFNNPSTNPPVDQIPTEIVLGAYSYAFEDNWPSTTNGDYDMNDFVVDIQITKYQNTDNKIEKVVLKNKIRAIGASKHVSAAIQLDNVVAGNVKSATYSKNELVGDIIPLNDKGIESGQTKAIVSIVDNGHAAFNTPVGKFIFTHDNSYAPIETTITIEFNTPVDDFSHEDLNPFIVNFSQAVGGRYEVHLVGRSATDKINQSVITKQKGPQGELSSDPFKTKNNEPFALYTPVEFSYPKESVRITSAYPEFMDWATNSGNANPYWYNNKAN